MSELQALQVQVEQTLVLLKNETTKFQEASSSIQMQISKLQSAFSEMESRLRTTPAESLNAD